MEEALREGEERFRAISDNMPSLAWMANADGGIFWYNRRWYDYTGTTFEAMEGWGWSKVHHPDWIERVVQVWQQALLRGESWEDTFPLRRADGHYRWFLSRASPIRDGEGKIARWFGTNTDITELRDTQNALRAANTQLGERATQLEELVHSRTAKLRETVAELEAFSYSIAHDMRAPLRSLQGYSSILLNEHAERLDEQGQTFLRRIAASAGRMDRLIQDVLSYSRVIRGDLPLEKVELDPLIRGIIETYPMFSPENADLAVEGGLPPVRGNEAMLTQVFSNLMGNATKFVAPGVKPRIRIWAESSAAGGVKIAVADNGIGIAPDQQERIFGIFQQINRSYEGTGIGLAIVKTAVERMGGQVSLTSSPGEGSTFWIVLQGP